LILDCSIITFNRLMNLLDRSELSNDILLNEEAIRKKKEKKIIFPVIFNYFHFTLDNAAQLIEQRRSSCCFLFNPIVKFFYLFDWYCGLTSILLNIILNSLVKLDDERIGS